MEFRFTQDPDDDEDDFHEDEKDFRFLATQFEIDEELVSSSELNLDVGEKAEENVNFIDEFVEEEARDGSSHATNSPPAEAPTEMVEEDDREDESLDLHVSQTLNESFEILPREQEENKDEVRLTTVTGDPIPPVDVELPDQNDYQNVVDFPKPTTPTTSKYNELEIPTEEVTYSVDEIASDDGHTAPNNIEFSETKMDLVPNQSSPPVVTADNDLISKGMSSQDVSQTQEELDLHVSQTPHEAELVRDSVNLPSSQSHIHSHQSDIPNEKVRPIPMEIHEATKLDEEMDDDDVEDVNLHISQTPGEVYYLAVKDKSEEFETKENPDERDVPPKSYNPLEDAKEMSDTESGKAVQDEVIQRDDIQGNEEYEEEEEEDEINMHISQSQFPGFETTNVVYHQTTAKMSENPQLQGMNATYISPLKSIPLVEGTNEEDNSSKDSESLHESPTKSEEDQNNPIVEEDEEDDLNLCITPSQKKDSLPKDLLVEDLTPIPKGIESATHHHHPLPDHHSKSLPTAEIDPFQLMLNSGKEEAATNQYSIYDLLHGTPNQLSGLSMLRNRGDVSNDEMASSRHDATQLDNLPSSQTFLSRQNTTESPSQKEGNNVKGIELEENGNGNGNEDVIEILDDDKEIQNQIFQAENSVNEKSLTKDQKSTMDSQDWLQAADRLSSKPSKSTSSDSKSESIEKSDIEILKENYEKKLKELEALKKALELANIPVEKEQKKEEELKVPNNEDIPASQLGTEEYAKILTTLANSNPNKELVGKDSRGTTKSDKESRGFLRSKTPELATGWDEDSGPLIALPQRKFNTFAKIASPANNSDKITTVTTANATANGDLEFSSTEKPGKMRRRFGTSSTSNATRLTSPGKGKLEFEFVASTSAEESELPTPTAPSKRPPLDPIEEVSSPDAPNESRSTEKSISQSKTKPHNEVTRKETHEPRKSAKEVSNPIEKKRSSTASPSLSSSSTAQKDSSSHSSLADDYLPQSFKEGNIPPNWANVWAVLESFNWKWKKGKGLVDFYYLRPDALPQAPFVLNVDYFESTDDLLDFIYRKCPLAKKKKSQSKESSSTTGSSSHQRLRKPLKGKSKNIHSDESEDDEFSILVPNSKQQKKNIQKEESSEESDEEEKSDEESNDEEEMDEEQEEVVRYDLRSVPWKDLWKILRSYGWSWDFGPNVLQYYFVPGYDFKKDKEAILGIHKFTTEEEVRQYLKKEYRRRLQRQQQQEETKRKRKDDSDEEQEEENHEKEDLEEEMWSFFYLSNAGSGYSASTQESQYNNYLDEDWTLAKNRRKRHREGATSNQPTSSTTITTHGDREKKKSKKDHHSSDYPKKGKDSSNDHQKDKEKVSKKPDVMMFKPSSKGKLHYTPEKEFGEEVNTQIPTLTPERLNLTNYRHNKQVPTASSSSNNKKKNVHIPTSPEKRGSSSANKRSSDSSPVRHGVVSSGNNALSSSSSSLFHGIKFVLSGIAEKLRERLEVVIESHGGKVLTEIPKEMNYYDQRLELMRALRRQREEADNDDDEDMKSSSSSPNSPYFRSHHSALRNDSDRERDKYTATTTLPPMKELMVMLSQAKDFRKPKFITAVIVGIPIVSIQYLFDCLSQRRLLAFDRYSLPITYSALHSYHLFPSQSLFEYDCSLEQNDKSTNSGKKKARSNITLPYRMKVLPEMMTSGKNFPIDRDEEEANTSSRGIFDGIRILNLTGMKIWEEILSRNHCQFVTRGEKSLYKLLLNLSETETNSFDQLPIDMILFDPITYMKSMIYYTTLRKQSSTSSSLASPSMEYLQKHQLLSEQELRLLQHCYEIMQWSAAKIASQASHKRRYHHRDSQQKNNPKQRSIATPFQVVSIDWMTHCIALQEQITPHCLDLFQLPADPIHYPLAIKFDQDFTAPAMKSSTATSTTTSTATTTSTGSGERYSKYDLVYFHTSTATTTTTTTASSNHPVSTATSSSTSSTGGIMHPSIAIGKIISFSRRNETAIPFAKVQLLDCQIQPVPPLTASANHHPTTTAASTATASSHIKLLSPKKFTAEMIISMSQLAGKVVLLHRKDYYRHHATPVEKKRDTSPHSHQNYYYYCSLEEKQHILLSAKFEGKKGGSNSQSQSVIKKEQEEILHSLQEEEVFCTSLDYERQYSVIPYSKTREGSEGSEDDDEDEDGSDDDDSNEDGSDDDDEDNDRSRRRKKRRIVLSQDI